jgi:hypothetical protein
MRTSPADHLVRAAALNDPHAARQAGRDDLSLMLMDARNRTLRWLTAFESTGRLLGGDGHAVVPLRWIGHAAWFQEYWIARSVQRLRGEAADVSAPRLPSVDSRADGWFSPERQPDWRDGFGPAVQEVRDYMARTLDLSLELLESAPPTPEGLHAFRLVLLHEDRLAERLAVPLTASQSIRATIVQLRDDALRRARAIDAAEGTPDPAYGPASVFVEARY